MIQQEAVNLAGVPTGPSHQASNERQTKIIKITKNTYSKPYMYTSIWNKYYIELIIKTPVFRVFWVIILMMASYYDVTSHVTAAVPVAWIGTVSDMS